MCKLVKFTDALQSRQLVCVVGGEMPDTPHPVGGSKWLLFRLATGYNWGPLATDIGPNAVS